jgi:Protein of unknown function (DUF1579)
MGEHGEPCMEMPKPGKEHERLKPFVGTFRAKVKLWMGPGDPMVSTGMMQNTVDLDGLYLRQEYTGDPGEGPFPEFKGRGFWGYNQTTKNYEGFWIDTASSVMQFEQGNVDGAGKVWTMSGQCPDPQTGKPLTKRSVVTLQDDNRHKLEMFMSMDGQEHKAMEIEYNRAR